MNFGKIFTKSPPKSSDSLTTLTPKEKLIHFEKQIKIILLNNDATPKEQIQSLLNGNNEPPSKFTHKIVLDKSTTLLVCIYYIKLQLSSDSHLKNIKLDTFALQEWIHSITGEHISISKEFVSKVKYKDQVITVHSSTFKTAPVDVSKYIGTTYFHSDPKYTTKPVKHKIGEIYHNADGVCDGAVINFLDSFAKALQQPKLLRNNEKINFLKELKSKNSFLISRDIYNRIDYYQQVKPRIYSLCQVSKMNVSNHNFLQAIINIAALMTSQKINTTFTKCRTYEHVMALIAIKYGDWFEYIYYEPNDSKTWSKMYFHKTELNIGSHRLNSFCSYMAYFESRKDYDIQVSLEISTYATRTEQTANLMLEIPKDKFEQQQLLLIAIDAKDENMIKKIVKQSSLEINFHYKGLTPLIMVIQRKLHATVKLFLEYGVDPTLKALPRIDLVKDLDEFKRNRNLSLAIIGSKVIYKTETGFANLNLNEFYKNIGFITDGGVNFNTISKLQSHIDSIKLQEVFPLLLSGISPLEAANQLIADENRIQNLILQAIS